MEFTNPRVLFDMSSRVAICIPTYRAAAFIDRTLRCAREQTHGNLEIRVSVDPSDDDTAQICRRHERADRRVNVVVQSRRLGWSQNANAALDQATAEYFFLYFHDDILEPTYVQTLLQTLLENPDAASAHCDLVEFGLLEQLKPAHSYEGPTLHRLLDFMMTRRGTTLRSLLRRSSFDKPPRFPVIHGDNHWSAYVFHMIIVSAGRAVGVNEPLYRRWQRAGSLTRSRGWGYETLESLTRGQADSLEASLALIEQVLDSKEERRIACHALKLFQETFFLEQALRVKLAIDTGRFFPPELLETTSLEELSLGQLDEVAAGWLRDAERGVTMLRKELATRLGD